MADSSSSGARAVVSQVTELWGRQPRGRRTLAILIVLGAIAAVVLPNLLKRTQSWTSVADGASPDDTQELVSLLQARDVPSRLREGKVEVDSDRVQEARAIAAAAGLPRGGAGLEMFQKTSFGQSSFAEQVNYVRALQGELARSITSLAQVQATRVHLALEKRSPFRDQDKAASASVALHLHPQQTLSSDQVRGVRQLVAASVAGMKPESVVIVDNHGNLLDGAEAGSTDRRADIETSLTNRVRAMLERVVGVGKVSVVTTAVVDDSKVQETQETYDNANPAVRSETRTIEGAGAVAQAGPQGVTSGVAGTRGNLPGGAGATTGSGGAAGGGPNERLQETKNYELSRTVRQTTKPDVKLTKLHVAVVVDYKTGADGKPAARDEKELAELTALARQAAGIDDTRGDKFELRSIPFVEDPEAAAWAKVPPPAAAKFPLIPVAIGGGAAVLVLGGLMMVLLRKKSSRVDHRPMQLALPAPIHELERVLEARPGVTVSGVRAVDVDHELEAAASRSLPAGKHVRDRVVDVVRGDVDRTAEVLTAWLSEQPAAAASAKTPAKGAAKGAKS